MINIVTIISTALDSFNRRIPKFLRFGKNDVQTSFESAPFGVDANPIKNTKAVYLNTGEKGKDVIVGYINKNQQANNGELRLYSMDSEAVMEIML